MIILKLVHKVALLSCVVTRMNCRSCVSFLEALGKPQKNSVKGIARKGGGSQPLPGWPIALIAALKIIQFILSSN